METPTSDPGASLRVIKSEDTGEQSEPGRLRAPEPGCSRNKRDEAAERGRGEFCLVEESSNVENRREEREDKRNSGASSSPKAGDTLRDEVYDDNIVEINVQHVTEGAAEKIEDVQISE